MKYLILALLLTGCSFGAPREYLEENYVPKISLNTLVEHAVDERLQWKAEYFKALDKDCKDTAKCIGKPTYVGLDPSSGNTMVACLLVKNDKRVSCSVD